MAEVAQERRDPGLRSDLIPTVLTHRNQGPLLNFWVILSSFALWLLSCFNSLEVVIVPMTRALSHFVLILL